MTAGARLLFVSKGRDAASTRYRALQFFPLLRDAGFDPHHVTASGGVRAFTRVLREARTADVVILLRKTFALPLFLLLRRCSRKLIFDFDDAIFCKTDGSYSPTRMRRFGSIVRKCDYILAGNDFLADHARRFNPSVSVIPTCLQTSKYQVGINNPTSPVNLVWIGSRPTRKYLLDVLPALALAAQRVSDLRLKIIANFDLPDSPIPTLAVQWSTETEAVELATAHIGIAPLRDDNWSRGKCALKVLQYMGAGLPVVSSHVGANAEVVLHGETGYLVKTNEEWAIAIQALADDASARARMGEAGRRRVESVYSVETTFAGMRPILEKLLSDKSH